MSNVDRREFLKLVGAGGVGVGAGFMLAESAKHPLEHLIPYAVPPEEFSSGVATWYNSVCGMCPAGCGISVRTREGRAKKIEGNPSHPVSQGRLCALGQAGLQVLYNPDRLSSPLLLDGASGSFRPATWVEGVDKVAGALSSARNVVVLSRGIRGHLAQIFERFAGSLSSANLLQYDFAHEDALYVGNRESFGIDRLPYYDIANTRYLVSFGADYLNGWISPVHHSLGFGTSRQGGHDRGYFVQVEPRMSVSGASADRWVPANPGTEGLLALGIAQQIVAMGGYSGADRDAWTSTLAPYDIASVSQRTGVNDDIVRQIAEGFMHTRPGLAITGGAATRHVNGVNTAIAVNTLNYIAGNVGIEGGILFNPAAPLATTGEENRGAYESLANLVTHAENGSIDALLVYDTDPVFTMPADSGFREALEKIPFVASLSSFMDETTAMADVVLPSHTYLESWGDDVPEPGVGFSVGAVSQPVVAPLYNTQAVGDTLIAIAAHMGHSDAIPWASTEECIKDGWRQVHAQGGSGDFDAFWRSLLQAGVYGRNIRDTRAVSLDPTVVAGMDANEPTFSGNAATYPFTLHPYTSMRMHDGRGANLPWMLELPDAMTSVVYSSWVEINPVTAEELGVRQGDVVEISSEHGSVTAPVYVYPAIMPDVVAMPVGQGHSKLGRYAKNRGSNPLSIVAAQTDAKSGSLAWAATRVSVAPTGQRAKLVTMSGESRELGRNIVQTTGGAAGSAGHSAKLNSIPIKVEAV
ncbi:MAG: molybdopterin-dependent oxidoreductase [Gammaproteobacteria bacterium]|nr:molybdopterin-dependent oxidoreductase [Gammaproteobacteria bacterium]